MKKNSGHLDELAAVLIDMLAKLSLSTRYRKEPINKSLNGCRPKTQVMVSASQRYFSEKGVYQNPYRLNSEEFNAFERGWMQSQKMNDGKLQNTEKHLVTPKRVNPSTSVDAQAERYRSKKE